MPPQIATIIIKVSTFEAALIAKLRKHPYGEFIVHKFDGEPKRVVVKGSEILKEADGLSIAEENQ